MLHYYLHSQNTAATLTIPVQSEFFTTFIKPDPYQYPIPRKTHMECHSYHEKNNVTFDQLWNYPPTKVLVGVFTTANTFERRQLLRVIYKAAQERLKDDWVDFKFIIGKPKPDEDTSSLRLKLEVEQAAFNDVVMLDIVENLNEGKIYEYYRWAGLKFNVNNTIEQYDYISKTDDDAFVHFQNLALNLRPLSREKLYYGFYSPVHKTFGFVTGMLEVLSIDHVRWISTADLHGLITGPEDAMVARWLEYGGWKFVNWIHENCLLYEDPRSSANQWCWRPWASPHTIVFHGMKSNWKWDAVIELFFGENQIVDI
ncbi:4568_t:CDS:2 [Ambispora gerdemannii]|uniref:Hexosyltransferase n=1 Tax=Ambispora gerdemannii TaxID=144530 RepID=A0A9N9AIU9_9GLOM|nr:4568_t:CDS:2 [Ambispora gerdemannii]